MVLLPLVALFSLVPSVFTATTSDAQKKSLVPGGYIIEFSEGHADPKSSFYSQLSSKNVDATHRMDLSSSIFNGLSFHVNADLDQAAVVQNVKSLPMVERLWPISLYQTQAIGAAPYANASSSNSTTDTFSTHIMGHVDQLHAEGITGNGTFIAIVDTGVDYNHPALGGGFGSGYKVAYGYDFAGDDYTGYNTPVPDPDPYTNCSEHGTHVTGIVGANYNEYNFTGVAPDATLGMYRVFGCDGSAGDDILIAAFTKAYEDGADIITASIGGVSGWTEEPWSVAVSRIVAAGTPCTLAAGNDGADGMFYGSEAADGIGVIAVGSIDNIESPVFTTVGTYTVDNSTTDEFGYEDSSISLPDITLPLYAIDYNTTIADDACDALPTDTPDLSGKLVLIRRGTCTFDEKAEAVAAYGAQYILFYNNVEGLLSASLTDTDILGAAMVSADQGATWIAELQSGSEIIVSITGNLTVFSSPANNITGGYMSTYTEWYPTNEVYIKPEISAPGGNILSTIPLSMGGYGVLSGTSMATPFVAGVVALMKQVRPGLDSETIRAILGTTGSPVKYNDGDSTYAYLAPVVQQGGGEINGYAAVHTSTVIDVPNISFNDTAHFVQDANFTITNRGSSDITYSLSYVDAATAYTLPDDGTTLPSAFPIDLVSDGATLSFTSQNVTVAAGSSEVVFVNLTIPSDLTTSRIPVYSGFITISGTNGDSLNVPYAGVASSLLDATVLDPSIGYPYLTAVEDLSVTDASAYTISLSNSTDNSTSTLTPELVVALVMPSSLIRADLITESSSIYTNETSILGVKTLGAIAGTPLTYEPRGNPLSQSFYGLLESGQRVPAGNYSVLVRALRIFGDPENPAHYDNATVGPFSITYVA